MFPKKGDVTATDADVDSLRNRVKISYRIVQPAGGQAHGLELEFHAMF